MDAWRDKGIYCFSLIAIVLLSGYFQGQLLFNGDVSWLMLAASRLLAGGNYTNDFFEVNPPLIIYLYVPPVLFSQYFSVFIHTALQLYVYCLSLLSFILCAHLLKSRLLLVALAATFLLMPITDFGQREHLMVLLTTPFILLSIANHQRIFFRLLVGVLAGIGFAIKPYFYFTFMLLEIMLCVQIRSFKPLLRIEVVAVLAVLLMYLLLVLVRHLDYLTVVIPHITQFYYQSYGVRLTAVMLNNNSLYGLLALMLGVLCYRQSRDQQLYLVLMAAILGSLLSFWWQQTVWYYHYYPVLVYSCLLIIAALREYSVSFKSIASLALLVLSYYCLYLPYLPRIATFFPVAYFGLLLVVTALVWKNRIVYAVAVLMVTFLFYQNAMLSIWSQHVFALTIALFVSLLAFFVTDKRVAGKCAIVMFALISMIYLIYPFYHIANFYDGNVAYKDNLNKLFQFLQKYPHKTLAFFSDSSEFAFPGVDYAHQQFASRYGCIGGLPVLQYGDSRQDYINGYLAKKGISDFIIKTIVADMQRYQPDLVLVDVRSKDKNSKGGYFGNSQMDYVKFFSINTEFKNEWQRYRYVKTIDGQPVYKFKVYQREDA